MFILKSLLAKGLQELILKPGIASWKEAASWGKAGKAASWGEALCNVSNGGTPMKGPTEVLEVRLKKIE